MTLLYRSLAPRALALLLLASASGVVEAGDGAQRCFVRASANGANDGSSWGHAYTGLQSALNHPGCREIWVAQGIYRPGPAGQSWITFAIRPGTTLHGGFAGHETSLEERSVDGIGDHPSILSGDIDQNDVTVGGVTMDADDIRGHNSLMVVRLQAYSAETSFYSDTVLDGFVVTGGGDPTDPSFGTGSGLTCIAQGADAACSPTLRRMSFRGNRSRSGGAMAVRAYGGGVAFPELRDVLIAGNAAQNGGGLYLEVSGGSEAGPTLVNVTVHGNRSTSPGGGLMIYAAGADAIASPRLQHVTITGNRAVDSPGGGLGLFALQGGVVQPVVVNTVLWGNEGEWAEQVYTDGSDAHYAHSIVQGSGSTNWDAYIGTDAGDNLDADPQLGTLGDRGGATWTRVPGAGSAAIDAGVCDKGSNSDQRDLRRPSGADCDIGAVEVQMHALYVGVVGGGSVSAAPSPAPFRGGIVGCEAGDGQCEAFHLAEAGAATPTIALNATVPQGWQAVTWSGDCAANGVVVLDDDKYCEASFAPNLATTSLTATQTSVSYGEDASFTAVVAPAAATPPPTGAIDFLADGVVIPGCAARPLPAPAGAGVSCVTSTLDAGDRTIAARYSGDANYPASEQPVSNALTQSITRAVQTLVFPVQTMSARPFVAGESFPISPLASSASPGSGNPIVYASLDANVCIVSGITVTMQALGDCALTANQAGDPNHDAAPQVTQPVALTRPVVDLEIAIDADRVAAEVAQEVTYTIVASNPSLYAATGVSLTSTPPTSLVDVAWACQPASSSATCPAPASGIGTLDAQFTLPPGSFLRFDVIATVQGNAGTEIVHSASVTAPSGVADPESANNASSATVLIVPNGIFASGFEQTGSATLANPAAESARLRTD